MQQRIESAISASADFSQIEASVNTEDANFLDFQKAWRQKTAAYEERLAEVMQEVYDKSADLPRIVEITSTASAFELNLASTQTEIEKLKKASGVIIMVNKDCQRGDKFGNGCFPIADLVASIQTEFRTAVNGAARFQRQLWWIM